MLKIYNTLTHAKEVFVPLIPMQVRLYVCGMTVYDYCHVGHARVMIVFDTIVRHLKASGYHVHYVRNITDIDDKIIDRAKQNGEKFSVLTKRYRQALQEDAEVLSILLPTEEPCATAYLPHMIQMIEKLIQKDMAYVTNTGDVYYSVRKFPAYGKLSHKTLDSLLAGMRVEIKNEKQYPLDFALWKAAKLDEPAWDSPWGKGRPGWHIECSAMSMQCLGEQFDIHGGGLDLQFPHHENEIAQSESYSEKPFVKTWMHVGFVQVNEEKMSKSLGNFFTIRDMLKTWNAEVIRYFLLSSHYRKPINYTEQHLNHAVESLERLYIALKEKGSGETTPIPAHFTAFEARFLETMDDDFNTPEALAVLFELVKEIHRAPDLRERHAGASLLQKLANRLGILERTPEDFFKGGISAEKIEAMILQRGEARANHDWATSDWIRELLQKKGIILEDTPKGTEWRRVHT